MIIFVHIAVLFMDSDSTWEDYDDASAGGDSISAVGDQGNSDNWTHNVGSRHSSGLEEIVYHCIPKSRSGGISC
jgi:hypothetical protein